MGGTFEMIRLQQYVQEKERLSMYSMLHPKLYPADGNPLVSRVCQLGLICQKQTQITITGHQPQAANIHEIIFS